MLYATGTPTLRSIGNPYAWDKLLTANGALRLHLFLWRLVRGRGIERMEYVAEEFHVKVRGYRLRGPRPDGRGRVGSAQDGLRQSVQGILGQAGARQICQDFA